MGMTVFVFVGLLNKEKLIFSITYYICETSKFWRSLFGVPPSFFRKGEYYVRNILLAILSCIAIIVKEVIDDGKM